MNATTSRTDIHRPSAPEFDPAEYECVGVYDLQHGAGGHQGKSGRSEMVALLTRRGYSFADVHPQGQCTHCGAYLRYTALMAHKASMTYLWIGEQCLGNRFEGLTKGEFQALRKAASCNAERTRVADRIAVLVTEHPALVALTDSAVASAYGSFTADVGWRFRKDGKLSPNQIAAVERVVAGAKDRAHQAAIWEENRRAERATAQPAPSGRVEVIGKVIKLSEYDGDFGMVYKMMVLTGAGYRVFVTIPGDLNPNRGDWVRFTATLKPAADDPTFAKGSRPVKGEIIPEPTFS